jgi:hypothetical protein
LLLTSPDDGAVFHIDATIPRSRQKIRISADASPNLARVVLLVNNQSLAEFSSPPYAVLWQLEPGEHVFRARGLDESGSEVVSDAVAITVRP